jgi:hypothetical protein
VALSGKGEKAKKETQKLLVIFRSRASRLIGAKLTALIELRNKAATNKTRTKLKRRGVP